MPKKIFFTLFILITLFLGVLGFSISVGNWGLSFLWASVGLLLLDIFWPKFDLAGASFWRGSRNNKTVALTFDDGPDPRFTPKILDELQKLNVKATFFVLGKFAEQHPEIIRRMANEGHEIGTHGYSHTKFTKLKPSAIESELLRWQQIVHPLVQGKEITWLRTPHGWKHSWVRKISNKLGYKLAGWTTGVWDTDCPGTNLIVEKATAHTKPGDILLLHDGDGSGRNEDRTQTVESVAPIVQSIRSKGLEFVTLTELSQGTRKSIAWGRAFVSACLTIALVAYVLKHFNLREILSHITIVSPLFLVASLALDLSCLLVKSQAWRELVMPLGKVPRLRTFGMYLVGAMLNNILPFRAGDLGRSDLLKRQYEVSRVHGYSTVMLEALLNGLSILPILFLALLFFPLQPTLQKMFLFFTLLMMGLVVVVFFIAQKSDHRWLKGFQAFKNQKNFWSAYGFLFIGWIFYLGALTCMLRACGLTPPFWAAPVLAISLAASMFIPAAPGRLGTFEAAIVLSLALFDISQESALGFALILHATQTFPTLLWGWIAWLAIGKK